MNRDEAQRLRESADSDPNLEVTIYPSKSDINVLYGRVYNVTTGESIQGSDFYRLIHDAGLRLLPRTIISRGVDVNVTQPTLRTLQEASTDAEPTSPALWAIIVGYVAWVMERGKAAYGALRRQISAIIQHARAHGSAASTTPESHNAVSRQHKRHRVRRIGRA